MEILITLAKPEEKETLRNLFEKYDYEFSQYDLRDVNDQGLYAYAWLDEYFSGGASRAYLMRVDGKLAGFAMVSEHMDAPERPGDLCLSEFFVMHKYRRCGVGALAVQHVLREQKGRWQIKYHPENLASAIFWQRVIAGCTGGNFELVEKYPNPECDYDDGTPASMIFFDNSEI